MEQYALYLRKSRADLDAEARGEGETLAKHRAALTDLARRRGLLITREYAELVSGDTILARPQMQQLLADVKAGLYAGVIVNDVDRLGRGDSIDQEIIKITFAAAHCLIITPNRDIDPANPSDDDMLDFSMFLARFEYKKIAGRLKQGKQRAAAAGNFISSTAPIGYTIHREAGRHTLVPDESTAPIVRMIFDWYSRGEAGYSAIATRLTSMGLTTATGHPWSSMAVRRILYNPLYIGRIEYGARTTVSVIEGGRRVKKPALIEPPVRVENAHEPLVSPETWQAVQDRARLARHHSPVNRSSVVKNPLAGLIRCAECGKALQRDMSQRGPVLRCLTHGCPTRSTYLTTVEEALLDILRSWCATYAAPMTRPEPIDRYAQREALQRQLDGLTAQLTRAQELVEIGVYTPSEYVTRRDALRGRQEAIRAELDKLTRMTPDEARAAILPACERVLDAYPLARTPEQRNELLRSVIDHVVYHKTQVSHRNEPSAKYLTIDVYPLSRSI